MNPQEITRRWYEISTHGATTGTDSFFRFIAIWIAFNALYASRHGSARGDRNQVKNFAGSQQAKQRHEELLTRDAEYQNATQYIGCRSVFDSRNPRRRYQVPSNRKLKDLLNCVYQIRCNLFHGGKQPDDVRDATLVEAGYTVISKLIEAFL